MYGPPVGYILVLVAIPHYHGHQIFVKGSNIRYFYIKYLFFCFIIVFISSQLDIYRESYDILRVLVYRSQKYLCNGLNPPQ